MSIKCTEKLYLPLVVSRILQSQAKQSTHQLKLNLRFLQFLYEAWQIVLSLPRTTITVYPVSPAVASGRDPFNQTFREFRSKTQWIGSVQPEKFRKNGSTFWGGPLFPVGPIGILVEWIAPSVMSSQIVVQHQTKVGWLLNNILKISQKSFRW